jgi:ubiquinone/menaquinone biosynthesis C-methylase UbiE
MTAEKQWQVRSAVFHTRAKEYDSWFDDSLLFDIETAAICSLAIPVKSPSLEIGVGPGRFAKTFGSTIGIDPALAPLQFAKSRNIAVCQAVGEALPFTGNSIARVSLFFTLCFVQDPAAVLRESYRVLKDRAHLVLGFVPATSQWGKKLLQKKEDGHPFYEHARFLSVEEIETLLAEQNFCLSASVSTLYQAPGNVTQMEAPRPGMDEGAGFVVVSATKDTT